MDDAPLLDPAPSLTPGSVSPHSLVLLFNIASDADHGGDLATLEATLGLARAIADATEETLRAEAERLAGICEESLENVRRREAAAGTKPGGLIACPECGGEVAANALRCRRCGHLFL